MLNTIRNLHASSIESGIRHIYAGYFREAYRLLHAISIESMNNSHRIYRPHDKTIAEKIPHDFKLFIYVVQISSINVPRLRNL